MLHKAATLALALAMTAGPGLAETLTGRDWQLLALDGTPVEAGVTLRIEADGTISGQGPCNSYGARTDAALPALMLGPIRSTRMACPRLDEEQAFFDLLGRMVLATLDDGQRLILTGPDGQTLEFVADRAGQSPPACRTCTGQD